MIKIYAFLVLFMLASTAEAGLTDVQINQFIGYTIVANKTIVGWYDNDGKKGDSFEGCNFNRVIVFDDNRTLTCAEYGYQYAYRPTATILSNGANIKMVVESDVYDMSR
ncbi:MAG: hypothetical protein JO131_01885 [Gammaproteobacteria bacterium]|nr:hypothetical protein [Gammaproteobacteria bacterium]